MSAETTADQLVPEPQPGDPADNWVRWHYARALAMRRTTLDQLAGTRRFTLHMVAIETGLLELAAGYLLDAMQNPDDTRTASEVYADLYELQEAADEVGSFLWQRLVELGVDADRISAWPSWVEDVLAVTPRSTEAAS